MRPAFQTPILFLIFNRPDTTSVVFEQLRKVQPTQLFFAADGPRPWVAGEPEKCEATRNIVHEVDWDCEVKTLFRTENAGCGLAVSAAITWFFSQVPEGIILEDDCLPDASFFPYCQQLLTRYRNTDKVKLIGGNNFQDGIRRGNGSYYFTHYPEIWGWATWRRTWQAYDYTMSGLEETLAAGTLNQIYKTGQERKYWFGQFLKTKKGKLNTWDYQLVYAILKSGGLAISPQVNLVKNIGIENNPTHLSLYDSKKDLTTHSLPFPLVHPEMVVDKTADWYTYSQIYSRSIQRLFRILKENGMITIGRYVLKKIF